MGSPLDDLRKISNQVERKKEENIKNIRAHKQLEKEMLSEGTLEQQKLRQQKSQAVVQRAEKLKLTVLIFSFLFVALLIFFIFKFVIFGANTSIAKVDFVSDSFVTLDAANESYSRLNSFIIGFLNKYKANPQNTKIPWYSNIPSVKKIRYARVLEEKLKTPGMEIKTIRENKDSGLFEILYVNNENNSLTFSIIENKTGDLEIVKIY